jgi:Rrf2 family protein
VHLAQVPDGKVATPIEIARVSEGSTAYLAKILGQLVRAGILQSKRGSQGGVCLSRPPEAITLHDVLEALHGLPEPMPCPGVSRGKAVNCRLYHALADIREATVAAMKRWTLADLMAEQGTGEESGRCGEPHSFPCWLKLGTPAVEHNTPTVPI